MSVTAGVSDVALAVRDKLRGKIGQTKVKRYWPGKAPEWTGADEDAEYADIKLPRKRKEGDGDKAEEDVDDVVVRKEDDRRLRRLAAVRVDDRDELRADHRRALMEPEIVSTGEGEDGRMEEKMDAEEEDEEAVEERRRRIKERSMMHMQQQEEELPAIDEEEEVFQEEESESEYETDSEEEMGAIPMVKPVFVPKSERDTIAERERLEAEELALEEKERKKLEERKVETRKLLVEEIQKDAQIQKNLEEEANIADVDTDDEVNEAEEYEAWKVREIQRIKRDRDAREEMLKQKEEIEKVRNMTEEERREWERKNPKPAKPAKSKWKYMQKYYHVGAFFQSEADDRAATVGTDNIYKRDYSAPTGEDKMDKTILPKVMQVKHFGRSGRTKWTHLVNEDTTDWNNPWTFNDPLRGKYNAKMAGMNAPIARPKGSKKMKDWEKR